MSPFLRAWSEEVPYRLRRYQIPHSPRKRQGTFCPRRSLMNRLRLSKVYQTVQSHQTFLLVGNVLSLAAHVFVVCVLSCLTLHERTTR